MSSNVIFSLSLFTLLLFLCFFIYYFSIVWSVAHRIDVTAADIIKIPIQLFGKHGFPVYFARCNQMTRRMLEGAGVVELLELYGGGLKLSVHNAVKEVLLLKKKKSTQRRKNE